MCTATQLEALVGLLGSPTPDCVQSLLIVVPPELHTPALQALHSAVVEVGTAHGGSGTSGGESHVQSALKRRGVPRFGELAGCGSARKTVTLAFSHRDGCAAGC